MNRNSHFWAWIQLLVILIISSVILYELLQFTMISVPLILGLVTFYALEPLIDFLIAKGFSRSSGVLVVFVITTVATVILLIIVPQWFYNEIVTIKNKYPNMLHTINDFLLGTEKWINQKLPAGVTQIDTIGYLKEWGTKLAPYVFYNIPSLISSVIMIIALTPVFAFFFLKDSKEFKRFFLDITPNKYYEMASVMIYKVNKKVGSYIVGRLVEALAVGVTVFIPTFLYGIQGAFLISFIVATTNIVPYIGPVVGTVIAAVLGLAAVNGSFAPIYVILIACGFAQLLDAAILSPVIVGKSMSLHPLVVFITFILAAKIAGILGLIVGVPIVATYVIILQEFRRALKNFTPV